jgi:hypothetical protein
MLNKSRPKIRGTISSAPVDLSVEPPQVPKSDAVQTGKVDFLNGDKNLGDSESTMDSTAIVDPDEEALRVLSVVHEDWEETSARLSAALKESSARLSLEETSARLSYDAQTSKVNFLVSDEEEPQQQEQSKQEEVISAVQEAVTQHTTAVQEQTQRPVGPALEQAVNRVRSQVAAVGQSALDLSQVGGDDTWAFSIATSVAALTTLQATKRSLATIGSNPLTQHGGETVVKGEATDAIITHVALTPVAAVAVTGLVSGMVSFFMISVQLVDIASLTLILFAPYVVYQKWQLALLGGLRGQQNRLRNSVNRLSTENGTLTRSIDDLETHVHRYVALHCDVLCVCVTLCYYMVYHGLLCCKDENLYIS